MSFERAAYYDAYAVNSELQCLGMGAAPEGGGWGDGYTTWGVNGDARGDSVYFTQGDASMRLTYEDKEYRL